MYLYIILLILLYYYTIIQVSKSTILQITVHNYNFLNFLNHLQNKQSDHFIKQSKDPQIFYTCALYYHYHFLYTIIKLQLICSLHFFFLSFWILNIIQYLSSFIFHLFHLLETCVYIYCYIYLLFSICLILGNPKSFEILNIVTYVGSLFPCSFNLLHFFNTCTLQIILNSQYFVMR